MGKRYVRDSQRSGLEVRQAKDVFCGHERLCGGGCKDHEGRGRGERAGAGGGKAIGIITQRDLINKVVAAGKRATEVKASSVMSSPLVTVQKDESLDKALELMREKEIRRIVVLDSDGKPFGILVELRVCGDLLDRQFRSDEKLKSWLEEYIEDVTEHQLEHSPELEQDRG